MKTRNAKPLGLLRRGRRVVLVSATNSDTSSYKRKNADEDSLQTWDSEEREG